MPSGCLSLSVTRRPVLKRKYVPDLAAMGANFEGNYVRMLKLLKLLHEEDEAQLVLHIGERYLGEVHIRLLESSRYTDTILLEQLAAAGKWLNDPCMTVRVYHDASMAEVISCRGHRRIEGANSYPNKYMHHPDEKSQLNAFLAEWLSFVLAHGVSKTPVFSAGRM